MRFRHLMRMAEWVTDNSCDHIAAVVDISVRVTVIFLV
ncbi:hypothetical protein O59_003189 [Cellvibrio sp. BR]|nr:hypothetical protein O59_003189 [Cellvibrio sp. BR]